jgi:hypothetical protein
MTLDDELSDEPGEEAGDITEMTPEDLAILFKKADKSRRIFYEEFVRTQSQDYQDSFYEAVKSPFDDPFEG